MASAPSLGKSSKAKVARAAQFRREPKKIPHSRFLQHAVPPTDRVYGAASAKASSFVVNHTQQISMAAVAGDAETINKQARKMRTNWVTHKQTADGFLRSAAVEGARTA